MLNLTSGLKDIGKAYPAPVTDMPAGSIVPQMSASSMDVVEINLGVSAAPEPLSAVSADKGLSGRLNLPRWNDKEKVMSENVWRPPETAPKESYGILLCLKDGTQVVALWLHCGWQPTIAYDDGPWIEDRDIVAWMPLPKPPLGLATMEMSDG